MTLTIEVTGKLEAALKAQADEQGLPADRIARHVLASALTPGAEGDDDALPARNWPSGKEKAHAFELWVKGHRDTPPLSDEALSRASMYPDRG
jgi:hypothetical protein